jgi:hypothetical protein
MSGSESILNKQPEELTQFLLEAARQDGAPQAARERALLSVTSVALSVGMASGAAALGAPSSLAKATSWVVAKWLVAGLTSGILTLAVAEKVQQLATRPTALVPVAPAGTADAARRAARANRGRVPSSLSPQGDVPLTAPEVAPELPPVAALPLATSAPVTTHDASAASPQSRSAGPGGAAQPQDKHAPGQLTLELSLLEQARRALAEHSAPRALQVLNDYGTQFPNGSLRAEAAALRVEAFGQAGDRASAQRLALAFLATYPMSPLAARVRALSDSFSR